MLQEFLVGRLEEHKVKLDAEEFDIIHSEHEICLLYTSRCV